MLILNNKKLFDFLTECITTLHYMYKDPKNKQ